MTLHMNPPTSREQHNVMLNPFKPSKGILSVAVAFLKVLLFCYISLAAYNCFQELPPKIFCSIDDNVGASKDSTTAKMG